MHNDFTLQLLLGYIYNRFALALIICLLGSFVKDCTDTIRNLSKINLKKILISSLSAAIIVCAISDYISFTLNVYVLVCFGIGLWSYKLLEYITDWDFVKIFLSKMGEHLKSDVAEKIIDAAEELDKKQYDKHDDGTDKKDTSNRKDHGDMQ